VLVLLRIFSRNLLKLLLGTVRYNGDDSFLVGSKAFEGIVEGGTVCFCVYEYVKTAANFELCTVRHVGNEID